VIASHTDTYTSLMPQFEQGAADAPVGSVENPVDVA
jgi:hypothetical protein